MQPTLNFPLSETEHSTMASIFDVTQVVPPSENQNENIS